MHDTAQSYLDHTSWHVRKGGPCAGAEQSPVLHNLYRIALSTLEPTALRDEGIYAQPALLGSVGTEARLYRASLRTTEVALAMDDLHEGEGWKSGVALGWIGVGRVGEQGKWVGW